MYTLPLCVCFESDESRVVLELFIKEPGLKSGQGGKRSGVVEDG